MTLTDLNGSHLQSQVNGGTLVNGIPLVVIMLFY